jgi:hypothetical protein
MDDHRPRLAIGMIAVRINGKRHFCPSSWHEVTVKQFVQITTQWEPEKDIADRDYYGLLNILTANNFTSIGKAIELNVTLINLVGWVIASPFQFDKQPPKTLKFGKKLIPVPQDASEVSIGQMIHLRRDFIDQSKYLAENISIATAILLQPAIDGTAFNLSRAKEIAKEIDKMAITLIHPIGFFLLSHAATFGMTPTKTWRQTLSNLSGTLKKMFPGSRRSTN